ncbi:MAG TPA: TetR/AcrR family transcriptional regulator [Armatimonadota bacterium]
MATRGVQNKRQAIMQAALKLFTSGHYHTTSIPEIAMLAGVGEGTIYHYFRCKSDLAAAIYCEGINECYEQMVRAAAEGTTPREKLDNVAHYMLRRAELQPELIRFINFARYGDYLPQEALVQQTRMPEVVCGILKEARCQGLLKDLEPEVLTLSWCSIIQGALQARRDGLVRRSLASLAAPICQCAWDSVAR